MGTSIKQGIFYFKQNEFLKNIVSGEYEEIIINDKNSKKKKN